MREKRYRTVIFDLDGTLLDTTEGVVSAVIRTIKSCNLTMPDQEILKQFVGPPMQRSMEKWFGLDAEKALEIANIFRRNYKAYSLLNAEIYDGILELLERLQEEDHQLAVATNKSHENAIKILKGFSLIDYFEYACGSDLQGKLSKSDIVDRCIDRLNTSREETVFIGDSSIDLKAAEEVGIDFIAVTYGFGFDRGEMIQSNRCIAVADTVSEIADVILGG